MPSHKSHGGRWSALERARVDKSRRRWPQQGGSRIGASHRFQGPGMAHSGFDTSASLLPAKPAPSHPALLFSHFSGCFCCCAVNFLSLLFLDSDQLL
ncbi:hypothetical protein VTN96DRAFT_7933 [Rasamsonia emersonii]